MSALSGWTGLSLSSRSMDKELVTKAAPYAPLLGLASFATSMTVGGIPAVILALVFLVVQLSAITVQWATKGMIAKDSVEDAQWKAWLNLDLDKKPELAAGESLGWARPAVSDWPETKAATGARLKFIELDEITDEDVAAFERSLDRYSGLVTQKPVPTDAEKGAQRLVRKAQAAMANGLHTDATLIYERARGLDYRLEPTQDFLRRERERSNPFKRRRIGSGYY